MQTARSASTHVLWVLLFLCMSFAAAAQPLSSSSMLHLSEYQKQNWQIEDGLTDNNIRMIAQQPDGTILLATSSGLATFDGQRFQAMPLEPGGLTSNESVNAVIIGHNDDLWIGTDGRGVLHRTASGTVNISELAGRFNERIRMLHQDAQGVLWIATQNGIERFASNHLEVLSAGGMMSGDLISPFAEDGRGGMLFVTSSGLFHWENGKGRPVQITLKSGEQPVAVYRDPQHRIWVGTTGRVIKLVPRKGTGPRASVQYDSAPAAEVHDAVSVLLGDPAGNLWIGTRHNGLWRIGGDGLTHWSTEDGLPDNTIRSLFVDDEQNLWIGMMTGGLCRWRKGALAPYSDPKLGSAFSATTFADSRGDLWLGTWGKGLFRMHNGQLLAANPPGMPITTPIRALAEDGLGHIWVGTWFQGVYRYDGKSYRHFLLGNESPGNAISTILPDARGGLWIGTYTGLFYFPSGEPDLTKSTEFLNSKLITCLIEDRDGSILAGTSSGLYRIRNGKTTAISGLAHPYILSLVLDRIGYVWAGTKAGGLAWINHDRATALPASGGISSLLVNTAVEDNDGHLWLGTSHGIVKLSVAEMHDIINGKQTQLSAVVLGKTDGMLSSEAGGRSMPASTRMPDGTLWFATAKGFVRTTDAAEKVNSSTPSASITGWSLANDPNASNAVKGTHVDLEADQPDVVFFFKTGPLANPAHVEFRYRLAGYDPDWTTTQSRSASYRRLPAGHYKFEVQARNSGEDWLSPPATISVHQRPHLYETWYFYLALCIPLALLTVQLFRRRVQSMKGRIGIVLEERNRIAAECHDTLMAGFAAISWQLEATAKLFRDSGSTGTPAAKSCELARSMVSHCQAEARRIIWDLRDTDEMTNVLSQALSRALSASHIQGAIETTLDVEGEEIHLSPGCVHHLVCIGQEAVSNAIRHAQPTHIVVHLKYESDSLSLTISDNGSGFQASDRASSRRGHFGIPVMEERARKLGGTFRLQTYTGVGTEVTVKVSYNALLQPVNQEHHVIRWIGI
ncbi:MAG TPA: two-component regulator propeller domain-containing protein [Edaphobacter sp.]|nr:two-component regulator propeller domain-containing protein [Edaphobacter sp.]